MSDVSFKHAPKISPSTTNNCKQIAYPGVLHLCAAYYEPRNEFVPLVVPVACILLESGKCKQKEYYYALNSLRMECMNTHNIDIINRSRVVLMGDYESALRNSMSEIWTNNTTSSCFFHFSQAVTRRISNLGLSTVYKKTGKKYNKKVYAYLRLFISLSMLPPILVSGAFNILVSIYKDEIPPKYHATIREFILYFKNYWMKSGIFILEWNSFGSSFRTNNALERNNALVNARVGCHPYLFDFIAGLRNYFCDGYIRYFQWKAHDYTANKRHRHEKYKNDMLDRWWKWIAQPCNQDNDSIVKFLAGTSKALKVSAKKRI